MTSKTSIDFFVSYTKNDEEWAEWITYQLEDMGYKVYFKKWALLAGGNYVVEINDAMANAKQTIAVLSKEYFAADAKSEWAVALSGDETGKKRKLLPIKVKPVDITGNLKSITAIDLVNLSEEKAKQRLLDEIKASQDGVRIKPSINTSSYPGSALELEPTQATQNQHQSTQTPRAKSNSHSSPKTSKLEATHEFKAGLVDKEEQAKHVFKSIGNELYGNDTKQISQSAFVLIGAESQWPHALIYILYYEIKKRLQFNHHSISNKISPEPVFLNGRVLDDSINPESHLWELLAETMDCSPERKDIENKLGNEKVPNILFRTLRANESKNSVLVRGMLEAWESLELPKHSPRHILILFYECADSSKSLGLRRLYTCLPWSKKKGALLEKIKKDLLKDTKASSKKDIEAWINRHFLPEITSPNQQNIKDWVDSYFDSGKVQQVKEYVIDEIKAEYKKRKTDKKISKERTARIHLTKDNIEMHHHDLKEILVNALKEFG